VPDSSDPCGAMDRETDVPLAGSGGLAAVDADPNSNRRTIRPGLSGECLLDRDRSSDRVAGAMERDKESVALCVDLPAVMGRERLPHQFLVAGK
jgi:hypothetical protein